MKLPRPLTLAECRLIALLRQRPPDYLDAIMQLLLIDAPERTPVLRRRARAAARRPPRSRTR